METNPFKDAQKVEFQFCPKKQQKYPFLAAKTAIIKKQLVR
jgi:hypothetical protein